MDSENIKNLLEKYWAGETNLEEDSILKDYFSRRDFDPLFRREAELFQYYVAQSKLNAKEYKIAQNQFQPRRTGNIRSILWNAVKVAAVVSVVITAGYLISDEVKENPGQLDPIADTFSDPNQAFEETKKALLMISKNLGKARTHAAKIKGFNEAESKLRASDPEEKKEKDKGNI